MNDARKTNVSLASLYSWQECVYKDEIAQVVKNIISFINTINIS